ncbi:MAG: L,D-transpeptidase family protein [Halocynthiibacter sp.]
MVKRLARAFSWMTIAALLGGAVIYLYGQYRPEIPIPITEPLTGKVDRILVAKAARKMHVYREGELLKSYTIALGFTPVGDKAQEGDGKTPEGIFKINRRNDQSSYHLSLGIDYPQADDRAQARARGVSPGGDIFIHGQPNTLKGRATLTTDWTAGCIAVSDAEIEELFAAVDYGTVVEITP